MVINELAMFDQRQWRVIGHVHGDWMATAFQRLDELGMGAFCAHIVDEEQNSVSVREAWNEEKKGGEKWREFHLKND